MFFFILLLGLICSCTGKTIHISNSGAGPGLLCNALNPCQYLQDAYGVLADYDSILIDKLYIFNSTLDNGMVINQTGITVSTWGSQLTASTLRCTSLSTPIKFWNGTDISLSKVDFENCMIDFQDSSFVSLNEVTTYGTSRSNITSQAFSMNFSNVGDLNISSYSCSNMHNMGCLYFMVTSSVSLDNLMFSNLTDDGEAFPPFISPKTNDAYGGLGIFGVAMVNTTISTVFCSSIDSRLPNGGCLHLRDSGNIEISGITATSVSSNFTGGVLYGSGISDISISHVYASTTSASFKGGSIALFQTFLRTINNGTFLQSNTTGFHTRADTSQGWGGAIWIEGTQNVTSPMLIEQVNCRLNTVQQGGGCLGMKNLQNDQLIFLSGINCTNNSVSSPSPEFFFMSSSGGGCIYESHVHLAQHYDIYCANNNGGNNGGCMAIDAVNSCIFNKTYSTSDIADSKGGSSMFNSAFNLTIVDYDGHFGKGFQGGSIYLRTVTGSLSHSVFSWNQATSGGSIYLQNGLAAVVSKYFLFSDLDCTFSSAEDGGCIHSAEGNFQILDSHIGINSARENGGGIRVLNGVGPQLNVNVSGTMFYYNNARFGGGLYISGSNEQDHLDLYNTTFYSNLASIQGGGIFVGDYNLVTSLDDVFFQNRAKTTGGAVAVSFAGRVVFNHTQFFENEGYVGSCITSGPNTTIEVYRSLIANNSVLSSPSVGTLGHFQLPDYSTFDLHHNQFITNAGTIFGMAPDPIEDNPIDQISHVIVNGSIFVLNVSPLSKRGGLYESRALRQESITHSLFYDNQFGKYMLKNIGTFENCSFIDNYCPLESFDCDLYSEGVVIFEGGQYPREDLKNPPASPTILDSVYINGSVFNNSEGTQPLKLHNISSVILTNTEFYNNTWVLQDGTSIWGPNGVSTQCSLWLKASNASDLNVTLSKVSFDPHFLVGTEIPIIAYNFETHEAEYYGKGNKKLSEAQIHGGYYFSFPNETRGTPLDQLYESNFDAASSVRTITLRKDSELQMCDALCPPGYYVTHDLWCSKVNALLGYYNVFNDSYERAKRPNSSFPVSCQLLNEYPNYYKLEYPEVFFISPEDYPDSDRYCENRLFLGSAIACEAGKVLNNTDIRNPECLDCPDNGLCPYGTSLANIKPEIGYWPALGRDEAFSNKFISCGGSDLCVPDGRIDMAPETEVPDILKGSRYDMCANGYFGVFCAECGLYYDERAGENYIMGRSGNYICATCPSPGVNALLITISFLTAPLITVLYLWNTFRGTSNNEYYEEFNTSNYDHSIILKIFLNALTFSGLAMELDFPWPDSLNTLFAAETTVTDIGFSVISFDCMFRCTDPANCPLVPANERDPADEVFFQAYYIQSLFYLCLPVILVLFTWLWSLWRNYSKVGEVHAKECIDGKETIKAKQMVYFVKHRTKVMFTAIIVVLFFLIHSTITSQGIALFHCVSLGPQEWFLVAEPAIRCFTTQHILAICFIGIPLIVFSIGLPLAAYNFLKKKFQATDHIKRTATAPLVIGVAGTTEEVELEEFQRHVEEQKGGPIGRDRGRSVEDLEKQATLTGDALFSDPDTILKYGFLFKGYRNERFYWEFVVLGRKMALVLCTVFMTRGPQTLVALGIATVSLMIQLIYQPFEKEYLNNLEAFSLLSTFLTFYCGEFLLFEDQKTNVLLTIIAVGVNLAFFVTCGYYFYQTLKDSVGETVKATGSQLKRMKTNLKGKLRGSKSDTEQQTIQEEEQTIEIEEPQEPPEFDVELEEMDGDL